MTGQLQIPENCWKGIHRFDNNPYQQWCRDCGATFESTFPRPVVVMNQGCICPPTSEQTCQSPTCPRQNPMKP